MRVTDFFKRKETKQEIKYIAVNNEPFKPQEKKFEFGEPFTYAKAFLESQEAKNKDSGAVKVFNEQQKVRSNNQWINAFQGVNSGLGTANYSFYNYQSIHKN